MAKDKTKEKEKRKTKIDFIKKKGFTKEDFLKLDSVLMQLIGGDPSIVSDKVFYWATYTRKSMKKVIESYRETLKRHADHEAYQKMIEDKPKEMTMRDLELNLKKDFPNYTTRTKELIAEDTETELRAFRVDWLDKCKNSSHLASLIIDFEIIDDAEKLLDIIYRD